MRLNSFSGSEMNIITSLYGKADVPFWMSVLFLNHLIGLLFDGDHK